MQAQCYSVSLPLKGSKGHKNTKSHSTVANQLYSGWQNKMTLSYCLGEYMNSRRPKGWRQASHHAAAMIGDLGLRGLLDRSTA